MFKFVSLLPVLGIVAVAKESPVDIVWWLGLITVVISAVVSYVNKPKR